jgi:hypothetical protein
MGYVRRHAIAIICAGVAVAAARASAPGLVIELSDNVGEFRLVNRGAAIRLESSVKIQREVGGAWQDVPVTNLDLTPACTRNPVPDCVSLAAGANLQPVPWSGNYCSSQCMANCNLDGPVPPGVYHYVVTSCDRKQRFLSAPFEKKAAAKNASGG